MNNKTLVEIREDELVGKKLDLSILNDSCLSLSFSHSYKTHFEELVEILRQEILRQTVDSEQILLNFIKYFRDNEDTEDYYIDWLETLKEYSYE